jgi:serine protease Do
MTPKNLLLLLVMALSVAMACSCVARTASTGMARAPAPPPHGEIAPGVPIAATLPDITRLANRVGPAVVNISTERTVAGNGGLRDFFQYHMGPGSPFHDFFKQLEPFFRQEPERKQRSLGSGFILDASGTILTNAHVVKAAERIVVTLQGGAEEDHNHEAKVIGYDEESDIALLRIDARRPLPFLELGDSDALQVGEWVVAIGNPFGLDHTVTMGIVSGKGRSIGVGGPYDDYIQTDASINPGNSGGPLINLRGQVVGVNTAIVATGQGIGFAIPSKVARQSIAAIERGARSGTSGDAASLGVSTQDVDPAMAKALGLTAPQGVIITEVVTGGAADNAGLSPGDVIVTFNGVVVQDSENLRDLVRKHRAGDVVQLAVLHRGKAYKLRLTLGSAT